MLDHALKLFKMDIFSRNKEFFEKLVGSPNYHYTPEQDKAYRDGLKKAKLNVISMPRLLGDYTDTRLRIANESTDKNLFKECCDEVSKYLDVANEAIGLDLEIQPRFGDAQLTLHKNAMIFA